LIDLNVIELLLSSALAPAAAAAASLLTCLKVLVPRGVQQFGLDDEKHDLYL
jgi:hypothetical protein